MTPTTETPTLAERIERLTEAVNAMTPGPWVTRPDLGEPWAKSIYTRPGYGRILGDVEAVSDAAGIIALRNDAMKIIADLARELAEAKRLNVRTADAGGVVIGELRQQLAAAISRERGLREAMQETIDDISEHHMDSVAERRASHRLKIALESGEAADGWRPIETAPQDVITLANAYLATRSARAGVVGVPVTVKDRKPRPHQKYAVIRGDDIFTAIPCYGMHNPWWVGRTLTDNVIGNSETEPCGMRDGDSYLPIADLTARLLPAPVAKEG